MYDRKIMCNGALMVCLNSLVLTSYKQLFITNMLKLSSNIDMCKQSINQLQLIEWPPKTANREKLVSLITITETTGGLSNP